ncbi:hypothetical protein Tco_0818257 [Tanacetum coccineum]
MYHPRFTKVIIHYILTQDKTVSWRNKIGMHTSKDDYLINTLKFVSAKEATQIYGVILPESLTSLEMKETKAYKTYLGFSTGATPPKIERKFKKAFPSKKDLNLNLVPMDEEPKSAKKKVPATKTIRKQTSGVVIRDTLVESSSKRKEKVDVARGKGIELLYEVALTEDAQYEEVRKKSLRDFYKTRPSGSGTVTKIAPTIAKIKPYVTNEGTVVKPGVPDVTEEESIKSEAESWGKDEDDNNNKHDSKSEGSDQERDMENEEEDETNEEEKNDEFVRTLSNDTDDEDKTNVDDNAEGDEDEEMDYTTSQLYDDVDIWLNKLVQADDETVQKEGTDAEMTNVQQGNENSEISQVIEDARVTLSTVPQKTEVLVTSSSHSSDLASKFINFSDIPHTDAEIVSPMDVHVHHEVPSNQTPTLLTVLVSVITESSLIFTTDIPQSLQSFAPWKRISEKRTKNQAKTDKTKHGMEKREKDKVKSKPKSTKVKVKVNPEKSKETDIREKDEKSSKNGQN